MGNFAGKRIAVIGDVMLDYFVYGMINRMSPENRKIPIVDGEFEDFKPGGAANVADNIRSLGGYPLLFGVIGNDLYSDLFFKTLKRSRISSDYIFVSDKRRTTLKFRSMANQEQVSRTDFETKTEINPVMEKKIIDGFHEVVDSVNVVIISDYAKGVITRTLCKKILEMCKDRKKPVIVDPKHAFDYYQGATVITPNSSEAENFSGFNDYSKELGNIFKRYNIESLLVTRGKDGMILYNNDGSFVQIPAIKDNVVDVTGAGDTSVATFGLALAAGASKRDAAIIANYCAAVAVGKLGTAVVSVNELLEELIRPVKITEGVDNG
jgi:D-beta-D-heptose 7-phosphate kinase/D-beta-D-heptose 1-phosphate adenosyltransferase